MNFEQQEMQYGLDPDRNTSKRVAYLSPMKICEEQKIFRIRDDHDSLQGLDPAKCAKVIAEKRKNYECLYDLYIALALLKFQDQECVMALYNFGYFCMQRRISNSNGHLHHKLDSLRDHWICLLINPRLGCVLVLDSAEYDPSSYAKFITHFEQ